MRESPGGLSMLKLYQSCPRKWALKYLVGWRESEAGHVSMEIGSALHDGIEVYLNTRDVAKGQALMFKHVSAELYGRAGKVWDQWISQWPDIFDRYDLLAVEEQYNFILPNGFKLTLRVDRILRDRETKNIYIVDTKFTGWSLNGTEKTYMYSPQPLLYHVIPYFLEPKWEPNFRGWLTDIVYQRAGGAAKGLISSPVLYPKELVQKYLESLEVVTGDIAYSVEETMRDPSMIGTFFPAYKGGSCTSMNSICPYVEYCLDCPHIGDAPRGKLVSEDDQFIKQVVQAFQKVYTG